MDMKHSNPKSNVSHCLFESDTKTSQAGNTPLFPRKLHEMLDKCSKDGKQNIVSWVANGQAFKVHDIPVFVAEILPSFFKQTKYKSFQRQLNLWGFERIITGPEKGSYHNKMFLQQQPNLCYRLKRRGYKKIHSTKSLMGTTTPRTGLIPSQVLPISRPLSRMPRRVSEGSLKDYEKVQGSFFCFDQTFKNESSNLANFEGVSFYLLDEDRYEELNHEFGFSLRPQRQDLANQKNTLLEALEKGYFGTT